MRCFSFLGSWIEVVCKNREGYSRMGEICDEPELENSEDEGCNEERIVVSVRLRPLNWKEMERRDAIDWECIDDNTIIFRNSVSERSNFPNAYTFDRVFRPDCPTKQVYEEAAKKVALSVVSGINASIFAYGQTSSGKTYTMSGVTEYTVEDIYDYVQRHVEREFVLKFSAMEIYNEAVRDLLSADGTPLRLLDDPERGTVVDRLTEETLRDLDHLKELLYVCAAQRQIGETNLNEASSRSHQILRLTIESCAREFSGKDKSSILAASVDFVDLAGSERASQALSGGTRLKEGCHINRSLLSLGTVVRKLSKGRTGHVPYRDSKLTRILQCSLGGNARTAIICTISPARSHVEQSRNTLQFASCAKEVSTNAQVNVVMSDKALVKQLQKELVRLQGELRGSKRPFTPSDPIALLREKDLQIQTMEKEIEELIHQRDLAQSRLETLVNIGVDQISVDWARSVQPPRLRAPLTMSDEDDLMSDSSGLTDRHLDVEFRGYNTTQYYNGYSDINSDDPYQQLPETPVDQFLSESISPQFSTSATKFVTVDPEEVIRSQKLTHETEEKSDQNGKEVQCVDKEELIVARIGVARDMMALASSPQKGDEKLRDVQTNYDILEKELQNVNRTVDCHVNTLPDESSPLLPEEDLSSSKSLELTENGAAPAQALTSLPQKGDENLREVQTGYAVLERELNDAQRTVDCHVNALSDESSSLLPEEHLSSSENAKLTEDGAVTDLASSSYRQQHDEELREVQTEYGILEKKLEDVQKTVDCLQKTVDGIVCPLPDEPSQLLMEEDLSGSKSLKLTGNEATTDQTFSSSQQKRDDEIRDLETEYGILEKELQNMQKTGDRRANTSPGEFSSSESLKLTENVEKTVDSHVNTLPDESSPVLPEEDLSSSERLKLTEDVEKAIDRSYKRLELSENETTTDQALSSSPQKKGEDIRDLETEYGILEKEIQNMQRTLDRHVNTLPDESSPLPPEDLSSSGSLKLTKNVEKTTDCLDSPSSDEPSPLPLTEDSCSSSNILKITGNGAESKHTLSSSRQKGDVELREVQTKYGVLEKELPDVQKIIDNHVDPLVDELDEPSPLPTGKNLSSSREMQLPKSRSCRASMMTSLPKVEQTMLNNEIDSPGRPVGILRKYSSSNFSPSSSSFSRDDSFMSEQSTSPDDQKVHDIATPSEAEINKFHSFVSGLKEMSKLEYVKEGLDDQGQETASKTNKSEKTVKDVGVETVQDHVGSPSNWPLEFERQQREIIELWQACNVSLVHRTYFFLLFKGDQSDSIYLEVERRRLSFLKDRMSQGNNSKPVMQGVPDHTAASSMKALRREREMLTKQMMKRLSEEERLNLYKKFGIALNTKQRRQQLARRLWTDTQDMNHIKESATLVARLVGLLEPGQALKEMFGLSFTPQEMSRRSHSWKGGRSSIL